jgi:RHS repeat-associated protein
MTRRPTVSRLIGLYPCTSPAVYCSTNNGNILEEDMTTPGVSGLKQTFTYDALNRLATATEKNSGGTTTWSETYGYDIYGNRWVSATTPAGLETAFTPTASSNFNSSNRLLNNGALYDLSGNQTTIGGYTNTFDAESRLATSTLNSITATYSYDGEGRRVQRVASGVTTQYVYDAQGQLAAEFSSQAPTVTGTEYLITDDLGSTRMVTNATGGCLGLHDYLPFGEDTINTLGGRTGCYGTSDGVAEKFTGKERDAETGLDYFGARYMSSAQGRFTSPDPVFASAAHLTDPQMWNEYAYVRNNPLKLTDPTGLDFYTTCAHTKDNGDTCQQVQNGSAKVWVQGTSDSNGNFTANRIANDANGNLVDINHGNAAYSGSFDETGVHFTAGGATSAGQFIDGSAQTNVQGSGAFQGMTGMFNSDCGGSCQARGSLWGDTTALSAAMSDGRINQQSKFGTVIDLLSGAHSPGTQWKDPQNLLHIIANANGVNAGVLELHYEGHPTGVDVVNFVLHMVDTISDKASGRAGAEQNRALPRN